MDNLQYSLKVRLKRDGVFYGPGVSELLLRVDRTGSLQTAAGEMGMSYSKAWKIVRTAEQELGFMLLERHVGGAGGGFSRLTEQGRSFVERYEAFQKAVYLNADRLCAEYFGGTFCAPQNNGEMEGERHEED